MMKNKPLLFTLITLVAVIIASLFFSQGKEGQKSLSSSGEATVKIGVLQYVTHDSLDQIYQGIREGLREEGFDASSNLHIDFMNAEGNPSQVQTMSKKLVANSNQLVIGIATPAAQGLANATTELPIIMGAISDPVGSKLVADLKKPGGNITGVSNHQPVEQDVALIQAVLPAAKKIGVLYSSNEDNSKSQVAAFTAAAEKAGLIVEAFAIASSNDLAATVEVASQQVDALFTPLDNTIASAFSTVVAVANQSKKPIFTSVEDMVQAGGLAAVSQNQFELGRRTGQMAAQVLKGANPSETPVTLFTEGEIILNQAVADQLGISFSEEIKAAATRILD